MHVNSLVFYSLFLSFSDQSFAWRNGWQTTDVMIDDSCFLRGFCLFVCLVELAVNVHPTVHQGSQNMVLEKYVNILDIVETEGLMLIVISVTFFVFLFFSIFNSMETFFLFAF